MGFYGNGRSEKKSVQFYLGILNLKEFNYDELFSYSAIQHISIK